MRSSFGQVCFCFLHGLFLRASLIEIGMGVCAGIYLELEEVLHVPSDCTLERLDLALKSWVKLCSSYHGGLLPFALSCRCGPSPSGRHAMWLYADCLTFSVLQSNSCKARCSSIIRVVSSSLRSCSPFIPSVCVTSYWQTHER